MTDTREPPSGDASDDEVPFFEGQVVFKGDFESVDRRPEDRE